MQQNITFRNSPPSASSMKNGQIVFARNSKGVAMYTKQGSQLFHTQFNSSSNVDKTFNKITPNIVEARDLSYTKFTDYRKFQHSFSHDINDDKHYLPWGSTDIGDNVRTFTTYLAPFKMTFHKLLVRPATLTATANYAFTIEIAKDGSANAYELGSYTHRNVLLTDDETHFVINGSDFFINAPYDSLSADIGQKVAITMRADADPTGSTYWTITSVWKIEVDLS